MFGKRSLSTKAVIVAQLLLIASTSQVLASTDTEWLHMALEADEFRKKGDFKHCRETWLKALNRIDSEKSLNPWTSVALRNLSELSLLAQDIDAAEKYSIRYVAELERFGNEYPDLARALITRGKIYAIRGQFDRSTECLAKARKIAHEAPVDILDRSEALTFLSANYAVLKDRKNSKLCEKELASIFIERRNASAYLLFEAVAYQLKDFAKLIPEKDRKYYLRVARDYYDVTVNNAKRFGCASKLPTLLVSMSDISIALGEKERAYSYLSKAREVCVRDATFPREYRASMLNEISIRLEKIERHIEATECLNQARKYNKEYDFGFYLNRQAGEILLRSNDFKRAKEFFSEAMVLARGPAERSYALALLSACAMKEGNIPESDRYFNQAWQEALQVKKSTSAKKSDDIKLATTGFNQIVSLAQHSCYPKLAAQAHAYTLDLMHSINLSNGMGDYAYDAVLNIEANQIAAAEKSLNTGLSLHKYSMDESEIVSKEPETDPKPADMRRWMYIEYFRLRGICAFYKNDKKSADSYFQQNLSLSERMKWTVGSNYCKFNGAMYFLQTRQLKESRRLFKEVIDFTADKPKLDEFRTTTMFWYAVALCLDSNYAESEKYIQLVIERAPRSDSHKKWLALTDALKGRIESLKGHHERAQALFDGAVAVLEKDQRLNNQDTANTLYWQLEDWLAQKQNAKTKELAKRAVALYEIRNAHLFSYQAECRKILNSK